MIHSHNKGELFTVVTLTPQYAHVEKRFRCHHAYLLAPSNTVGSTSILKKLKEQTSSTFLLSSEWVAGVLHRTVEELIAPSGGRRVCVVMEDGKGGKDATRDNKK